MPVECARSNASEPSDFIERGVDPTRCEMPSGSLEDAVAIAAGVGAQPGEFITLCFISHARCPCLD